MSEKDINPNEKASNQEHAHQKPVSQGRRDAIKALATVPVLGAMAYGVYSKRKQELRNITSADMFHFNSEVSPLTPLSPDGKTIRLGIIGSGIRGKQLMIALGFATPQYVEELKQANKQNSSDNRYRDFREQEDLKVVITAVCDIFDVHAEEAIAAGANIHREGLNGTYGTAPRRYRHYRELLAADDVDAVVIAAPDHWHGQMALDAALAGKHVYLEKPMTWTVPETYTLRDGVKKSGIIFQLGHQNRQVEAYSRAREIVNKGLLGPVTLIETGTNRNDPNGAWVYPIHPDANPQTIDWQQFEGDPERVKEYMDY
ncbi:MAG: hypothetical protein PWQ38_1275, partial [Proteiniphilum sp.]|nr:hypothetical protein [Proteiniphilum sp.]